MKDSKIDSDFEKVLKQAHDEAFYGEGATKAIKIILGLVREYFLPGAKLLKEIDRILQNEFLIPENIVEVFYQIRCEGYSNERLSILSYETASILHHSKDYPLAYILIRITKELWDGKDEKLDYLEADILAAILYYSHLDRNLQFIYNQTVRMSEKWLATNQIFMHPVTLWACEKDSDEGFENLRKNFEWIGTKYTQPVTIQSRTMLNECNYQNYANSKNAALLGRWLGDLEKKRHTKEKTRTYEFSDSMNELIEFCQSWLNHFSSSNAKHVSKAVYDLLLKVDILLDNVFIYSGERRFHAYRVKLAPLLEAVIDKYSEFIAVLSRKREKSWNDIKRFSLWIYLNCALSMFRDEESANYNAKPDLLMLRDAVKKLKKPSSYYSVFPTNDGKSANVIAQTLTYCFRMLTSALLVLNPSDVAIQSLAEDCLLRCLKKAQAYYPKNQLETLLEACCALFEVITAKKAVKLLSPKFIKTTSGILQNLLKKYESRRFNTYGPMKHNRLYLHDSLTMSTCFALLGYSILLGKCDYGLFDKILQFLDHEFKYHHFMTGRSIGVFRITDDLENLFISIENNPDAKDTHKVLNMIIHCLEILRNCQHNEPWRSQSISDMVENTFFIPFDKEKEREVYLTYINLHRRMILSIVTPQGDTEVHNLTPSYAKLLAMNLCMDQYLESIEKAILELSHFLEKKRGKVFYDSLSKTLDKLDKKCKEISQYLLPPEVKDKIKKIDPQTIYIATFGRNLGRLPFDALIWDYTEAENNIKNPHRLYERFKLVYPILIGGKANKKVRISSHEESHLHFFSPLDEKFQRTLENSDGITDWHAVEFRGNKYDFLKELFSFNGDPAKSIILVSHGKYDNLSDQMAFLVEENIKGDVLVSQDELAHFFNQEYPMVGIDNLFLNICKVDNTPNEFYPSLAESISNLSQAGNLLASSFPVPYESMELTLEFFRGVDSGCAVSAVFNESLHGYLKKLRLKWCNNILDEQMFEYAKPLLVVFRLIQSRFVSQ